MGRCVSALVCVALMIIVASAPGQFFLGAGLTQLALRVRG